MPAPGGRSYTCCMTLELRQLRHVLCVAEHGSIGRAAEALNMTQPALTRSLQALEHEVGAPVFERSKRGVVPTDEGRLFLDRAREVVHAADELDRRTRRLRVEDTSSVSIGVGPFPAEMLMPGVLPRFIARRPNSQLRVLTRDWDELHRRLRARELAFFVAETSTLEHEPDLDVEPLAPHPIYMVARARHPLANGGPVKPCDLFGYPLVALSRIPPRTFGPFVEAYAAAESARRPFPAIEFGNFRAVKDLVLQTDAVAGFPYAQIADEVESGTFVLLVSEPWLFLHYGIVTLKGRDLGEAASDLRDCIREAEAVVVREETQLIARGLRAAPHAVAQVV